MVGEAEGFKGGAHLVVGILTGALTLHNLMEFTVRREARLLGTSVVYAAVTALEVYQTWRHWARAGI